MDPGCAYQVQPGSATTQKDPQVIGDEKSHQGRQVGGSRQENRVHVVRPGTGQLYYRRCVVL